MCLNNPLMSSDQYSSTNYHPNSSCDNRSSVDEDDKFKKLRKWSRMRSSSARMASDENIRTSLVVITRPKGGRRALPMNLEEVKACKDLGFELEHYPTLPVSSTSKPNSPFAHWHISSPGDDPRDVKARLKVWAQAVALVSSSSSAR